MSSHPLRDLASKLRQTCKDHPSYSQAFEIVENCASHLDAVARTYEACEQLEQREQFWKVALNNALAPKTR